MTCALMLVGLTGCPSPQDPSGLDAATVPLAGECAMDKDYGGFVVQNSGVEGSVSNGVVPTSVLENLLSEGDCRVLRRNNPFCDPGCSPGQTCDFDGTCVPYPANQDLGVVSVAGLASDVSMEPVFPGNTYFDTSLPQPPFGAGDLVTLDMPEGTYGPATLHGVGFEGLVSSDPEWVVEDGKDLVVRWSASTAEVKRSEVTLRISIDQHGVTPGAVYCTFDDDGEGTVPAGIISKLVESGVTGFPTGTVERRTVDSVAIGDGCMDLTMSSPVSVDVDVVGFTPCISTEDCPDGQTCNLELQVCE